MQRPPGGSVVGEERGPDGRLDDVVADHRGGDRHDHHPEQRRSVPDERAVEEGVHQDRDDPAADRGDHHREPDVHARTVEAVGNETGPGHHASERQVQDVRDAELQREARRADGEQRRGDQTETDG